MLYMYLLDGLADVALSLGQTLLGLLQAAVGQDHGDGGLGIAACDGDLDRKSVV